MIRVDSRESAHLKSRVKDLSVVPNVVSYSGLFACVTPISRIKKNAAGTYDPILVRDVESLITNFGDPRVDPEKYKDLYCIMQLVANGGTCYVAKVDSGDTGEYEFAFVEDPVINTSAVSDDIDTLTDGENDFHDLITVAEHQTYTIDDPLHLLHNLYLISGVRGRSIDNPGEAAENAHVTAGNLTCTVVAPGVAGNLYSIVILEAGVGKFNISIGDIGGSVVFEQTGVSTVEELVDSSGTFTFTGTGALLKTEGLVPFTGGKDAVPATYHDPVDVNPEDYTYNFVGTDKYSFTLVYTGSHIDQIQIGSAELDPNYGRENITLEEDTSVTGPLLHKVYYTNNELVRKYSFITVKDSSTIIENTDYSVKWEKVNGKFKATFTFAAAPSTTPTIEKAARQFRSIYAYSAVSEDLSIYARLVQLKPLSLKLFYLYVDVYNASNKLVSAKVKLDSTTTNQAIVNSLNSSLGDYLSLELVDPEYAAAAEGNNLRDYSIAYRLLNQHAHYTGNVRDNLPETESGYEVALDSPVTTSVPNFKITLDGYINAVKNYDDHRYVGCLLADLTSPVTIGYMSDPDDDPLYDSDTPNNHELRNLYSEERRSLHYHLKQIAAERKDSVVILSTPLKVDPTAMNKDPELLNIDEACNWVASQGDYTSLWEYGESNTVDPLLQSFYLEIYYGWLDMKCTKVVGNIASSVNVALAPSALVINNILTSWRTRGTHLPVAGDQGGVLPDTCVPIVNPATKLQRDQLVQYRINPIWDTGTRGVQIFGNETLNAGYTDLNAAHIARTLVFIRSAIDEYTERLKFSINSLVLWDKWKAYVSQNILEPLKSVNALAEYQVEMGENTTSAAEIANRKINGLVHLRFYQAAEIFNLTYTIYSSATTIDEARKTL